MHSQSTILQKANSPTGLQNPSAWACPNWAMVCRSECQPSINSTNVVWNTFAREFSEGRQSGERNDLGLSFASFGQAKEEESYMPISRHYGFLYDCPTAKYVAIAAECIYGETEQPVAMSMMNLERRW